MGDYLTIPNPDASSPAGRSGSSGTVAAAVLGVGVALGIAGLFPGYLAGASLARQPAEVVPHAIYLASWTASAVVILLAGSRARIGALLGIGTSAVTFGLYFADAGTAIVGGAHTAGTGLVLGLLGWFACTAGATVALLVGPARRAGGAGASTDPVSDQPALASARVSHWRDGHHVAAVITLILAGIGAALTFAPAWDSFTLRTSAGATQYLTAGNAFANPALVITGDVAVMVGVVAAAIAASLWRPARHGAALLLGATIPLVAQAVSALVQLSQPTTPAQFGFTPGQATQIGLMITSGLTAAFWVYCAFLAALVLATAQLAIAPAGVASDLAPAPAADRHGTANARYPGAQYAGVSSAVAAPGRATAPGTATPPGWPSAEAAPPGWPSAEAD
ncbi:MAG TPA: hypothetical protein VNF47_13710 [Streptosporangiaceae bacterium]|nr:hypothetical protein [Streptosporangiaceae bacterium]